MIINLLFYYINGKCILAIPPNLFSSKNKIGRISPKMSALLF